MNLKLTEMAEKTRQLTVLRERLEGELKESERARRQAEELTKLGN